MAENNYLYIAENKKGIVKIGVTKNNPYDRVESFSQYYTDKFDLVTYFNVKNMDRFDIETFFHEILNSQFLNINYLHKTMLKINAVHSEIVEKKLNGYTELFVENKTIIKNLLIFLNLIDIIDLKVYDIDEINKIKDYTLDDVKTFKKYHKDIIQKEYDKLSLIKPIMYNKADLLLKNTNNFFGNIDAINFKHLSLEIDSESIYFKSNDKKLSITNFIYSNLDKHLIQCLVKTKTYKTVYFDNLKNYINQLRLSNKELSTQFKSIDVPTPEIKKRTYTKKNNDFWNKKNTNNQRLNSDNSNNNYPKKEWKERPLNPNTNSNNQSFNNDQKYPKKEWKEKPLNPNTNSNNQSLNSDNNYPKKEWKERPLNTNKNSNNQSFNNDQNYPKKEWKEKPLNTNTNSNNQGLNSDNNYPKKEWKERPLNPNINSNGQGFNNDQNYPKKEWKERPLNNNEKMIYLVKENNNYMNKNKNYSYKNKFK